MGKISGSGRTLVWAVVVLLGGAALAGVAIAAAGGDGGGSASQRSLRVQVAASADDAEEKDSGLVRLTSNSLELVTDDTVQTVGLRFAAVDIPAGSRITNAHVEFTVDAPSDDDADLTVGAQANAEPAPFVEVDHDVSSRPLLEATARWTPPAWGDEGRSVRSAALDDVLQAVIDQPGWDGGNPIVLVITGSGSRAATSFDGEPSRAPALTVDFEPPPGLAPTVEITSPDDAATLDGELVATGTAADPEDGDLSDAIQWSSDRDGDLGVGARISSTLRPGPHRITATVEDADGIASSASIGVHVVSDAPMLLAAGDIGLCGIGGDEATAEIIEASPGATVLALGDLAYGDGTAEQFANCYDTSWGAFKERTRAVPGNHDYHSFEAAPFFDYFADAPFDRDQPWYSFDVGAWHLVGLDTNCLEIGGCGVTSEQALWLARDLASNLRPCTLVFSHHPRYSSGSHGPNDELTELWRLLMDFGVDVMISGHDHGYERFAPQDEDGEPSESGLRQFVVGTGGAGLRPYDELEPNSEVADATSHGLLQLALHETSYDWEFLPAARGTLRDAGSAECNTDEPDRLPPEVVVTGPAPDTEIVEGEAVTLSADAGDLTDRIIWSSDTDGELGTGGSVTADSLSPGRHRLVAAVEDDGWVGADAVEIVVRRPGPPVVIVESRPAGKDDDAEEVDDGSVLLDEGDLELGAGQVVGIRFPSLEIPAGAEIVRAWVQFHVADPGDDAADLELRMEVSDDAAPFDDEDDDISDRPVTEAMVRWRPGPWADENDAGDDQRTPDLTSLLNEVIGRPGWTSGGAVVVQVKGSGQRPARAFGSTASALPVLHVEYAARG